MTKTDGTTTTSDGPPGEIRIEDWRPRAALDSSTDDDLDALAEVPVHSSARRRGIARAPMIALESAARAEHRTLLTLDT